MAELCMDGIPNRVFKGVYEITDYIHELAGEGGSGNDFSDVPDTVDVKAIRVAYDNPAMSFIASASETEPLAIQVLSHDYKNPVILVQFGAVGDDLTAGKASFVLRLNVFRDVRKVAEFIVPYTDSEGEPANQVVIVAYLENMRIAFLKEGEV